MKKDLNSLTLLDVYNYPFLSEALTMMFMQDYLQSSDDGFQALGVAVRLDEKGEWNPKSRDEAFELLNNVLEGCDGTENVDELMEEEDW